jgi:acyl carrier protein
MTNQKKNLDEIKKTIETICEQKSIATPEGRILENIDSLGLVELVIELEDAFNPKVPIVSGEAFSKSKSPFRTIDTLAEFILGVI